jgi:hypothetical protein
MVNKVCVLHEVQRVAFALPLGVKLRFGDFTDHASLDPSYRVTRLNENFQLLLFNFLLYFFEVLRSKLDFEGDCLDFNGPFLSREASLGEPTIVLFAIENHALDDHVHKV